MLRLTAPTRVRTAASISRWQRASGCRSMHQALAAKPEVPPELGELIDSGSNKVARYGMNPGPLAVRKGRESQSLHLIEELERRVQELDEAIKTDSLALSPLSYTEEELAAIYEDVLAVPISQAEPDDRAANKAVRKAQAEEDQRVLQVLERRLCDDSQTGGPTYRRILERAHEIVCRAEAARLTVNPDSGSPLLPMGVLSVRECEALISASMKAGDAHAAEITLTIMKRDNLALPENAVTNILRLYSEAGHTEAANSLLAYFLTQKPTEVQRHLHVQAHLKGASLDTLPRSALDLLHHYENLNVPAPMQTYTAVITSLFSRPSALARAQAWDIFTHMRYVAHPTPDAVLYTQMIRACANPVTTRYSSEPEKALDLWTEMTVDQNIPPTVGAYNAVVLACARSGTKVYVNEAFRLVRQMLDSHRDARGYSAFRPDKKTFCALLEGTKRIGDLGRARWILAEMVKGGGADNLNAVDAEIDEEVMMHIFHAYAAYKPPFIRSATALVKGKKNSTSQATQSSTTSPSGSNATALRTFEDQDEQPSFAHIPPQSKSEVIREVKILFNRILKDRSGAEATATASLPFAERKFRHVELTTSLLTSYLSVFYNHASLETSREMFWKIFENVGVVRSPRTFIEALERCANARRGSERGMALRFADELWAQWQLMEEAGKSDGKPLNSRIVERAYIAMIRVFALTEESARAMSLLRTFAATYPPNTVRIPTPKLPLRSTRTVLVGARPLVRMTSAAEVPDDDVPPLITFKDIEILHHRLIDEARTTDIKYVTWLTKAYEWALRIRRDETIKARIVDDSGKSIVTGN